MKLQYSKLLHRLNGNINTANILKILNFQAHSVEIENFSIFLE